MADKEKNGLSGLFSKAKQTVQSTIDTVKDKVEDALEIDLDDGIGNDDLLALLLKSKGSAVNRADFLQKTFEGRYPQDVIDRAIATTPYKAGIPIEDLGAMIDELAEQEKVASSMTSTVTDVGKDAVELKGELTSEEQHEELSKEQVADLAKKAGGLVQKLTENKVLRGILRMAQQEAYLLGSSQIQISEKGIIQDPQSKIAMLLMLAVMDQTEGAGEALHAISRFTPEQISEEAGNQILKSGELADTVKKWSNKFYTEFVVKTALGANPLASTAMKEATLNKMFVPRCMRLKEVGMDSANNNPNHVTTEREQKVIDEIQSAIDAAKDASDT